MKRKRQTAFHESAHAVLAHHSRFYFQSGMIRITERDGGKIRVSLNKKKLADFKDALNMPVDLGQEIAEDYAVILCGGIVGAEIAKEMDPSASLNPKGSMNDYVYAAKALEEAGLPVDYGKYRARAREILSREWLAVENIAMFLFSEGKATAQVVHEMIETPWWPEGLA